MIFRKYENEKSERFPENWSDQVSLSFNEYFKEKYKLNRKIFYCYGFLCKDELLIGLSLNNETENLDLPITVFLSKDLSEEEIAKPKLFEASKKEMLEALGLIFRDLLGEDEVPYFGDWLKYEFKKSEFYYKVSREDLELYIQAEALLNSKTF